MNADPFASPKLKLVRAKKNRDDFVVERGRFINTHPWSKITDTSADGFSKEFKVKLNRPFPDTFSELVSYATNNLRACLDGAAWATAACSGKKGKNAPFPFGDSPDGLENVIKRSCKDIPPDILTVMRGFKPYKTGNALLWAINHVANLDKHALVIPMAAGLSSLVFTSILPKGSVAATAPFPPVLIPSDTIWRPENNEIVYAVSGTILDSEIRPNYDVHIMLDIALGEIEVVGRQRAIGVLHHMICEVESILMAIEVETQRLFPAAF
jgi:hypothetical protein